MSNLDVGIKKLEDLLYENKLNIPFYQRPYSWSEKQIEPLLQDLYKKREKEQPIIMGGIILHECDNILDIVDGQQRLLTYSIIKYLVDIGSENATKLPKLLSLKKDGIHADTIKNIENNAQYIKYFIKRKGKAPDLSNIFFILVKTGSLEDAFSFFDSQNTRGKKLEAYDILKAHHLRFIESNELATLCAKDWENIQKDKHIGLSLLLETLLLRIRKWSRNQHYSHDIREEFKSQRTSKKSLNHYELSRYSQAALFGKWKYNPFNNDLEFFFNPVEAIYKVGSILVSGDPYKLLPFQLGQTIEGGELFFWYTRKYYLIYKELFATDNTNVSDSFKNFIVDLKEFNNNTGTKYTYQVFEGVLLFFFDKFGYTQFEEAAVLLFYSIYWLRMKQGTVQYASIYKYIRENEGVNPFLWIQEASFPDFIINKSQDYLEDKYIPDNHDYKPNIGGFKGIRRKIYEDLLIKGECDFLSNNLTFKIHCNA